MKTTLAKIYRRVKKIVYKTVTAPKWIIDNLTFAYSHKKLKNQKKIIYTLTPPPYLKNIGDHAQVIAIRAWLNKHFSKFPVIEMDKNRGHYLLPALQWLVQPDDIFFLHSGGNLGDRGKWSEGMRREMISTFPNNQIISLPQTIFFSDTPSGQAEKEISRSIYASHPNLTLIGRDPRSGELAAELFPQAQTFCMPDFVLSLPLRSSKQRNDPPQILLCLRLDIESALTPKQRQEIGDSLPYECTYYDTTLEKEIAIERREATLDDTLKHFLAADIVVTDRYHGLIFTVLCQKPCVVLQTVDHKLTSAIHWFKDIPSVMFAQNLDEIPSLVENCLKIESQKTIDWSGTYFDKIPQLVGLQ
ncbi:Exopolysaccharide biosynthesis protein [Hyella patelloides LEGE 07179]|uniref:Exopolysaccharide biosynthesis protein n=1 Tax=Hyella patelloides LEGE 07179 TaxID=945734 RepID=A0A563VP34_9CYAN|nr:polysaccharide pyruvyl transferase family protein [Hyella patelloides]VEP13232.1 Exopolysaccharide biosynthesis protein [Hyella patelloides LEGE 07179]